MYNLYFDEIWPTKKFKKYLFFCCLAVEIQNIPKLCKILDNCRCLNENNSVWVNFYDDCKNKFNCNECNHKLNNSKIHFSELKHTKVKHKISRCWINLLELEVTNLIKINLFVVNLDNLNLNFFGKEDIDKNIRVYNKLFRTVISGTYKYLLKNYNDNKFQSINKVYHHRGVQEQHIPFFKNISKLNDVGINIVHDNIIFVSGHQEIYPKDKINLTYANTLIQYCDLIIGSFRQLMYQSSNNVDVRETANKLLAIFKNIENNQYKINNKYRGIYDLNIWPNNKCDQIETKTLAGEAILEFPRDNSLYSHSIEFLVSKIESKRLFDF